MKKTTKTTPTKTPAPAKKAVKTATKAVKKAVVEVKKAAVKKAAATKTAVKKTVTKKATSGTAKKTVTPKATEITISAKVNIGYGNTLFLRGEGKGLSWDQGVSMTCVADDEWSITVAKSAQPRVFKFLINDEHWCTGEDYSLRSDQSGTFTPSF